MDQYLNLAKRVLDEGEMVHNSRTGIGCLTVINADLEYDVENGVFPLVTTRKAFYKSAIAELLGYLRGYSSAADFRAVGTPTWDANANENKAWLANPRRKGVDDMGRVYGVQGRDWQSFVRVGDVAIKRSFDQLQKIVDNLSNGIDDRGEILTFWNPGEFDQGCLRPCMYSHHFSIHKNKLYLNSTQRSCDLPLGLVANMVQAYVLLALMAQITGIKPGKVYHKIVNVHIYENQIELMKEQVKRLPYSPPKLVINPNIKTLKDVETWVTTNDFTVTDYQHHEPIKYPFAV